MNQQPVSVQGSIKAGFQPEGYAIESDTHAGSVQIYQASALKSGYKDLPNVAEGVRVEGTVIRGDLNDRS